MNAFMDQDFLLNTEAARKLYHEYAENLPIIDYHCHINPREIAENKVYPNIAQLWLGVGGSNFGDHYKWRFMRSCGVDENIITGDAPDEERFVKWAECLSRAIGNPLYHWSHLELKTYFGFEGYLNASNAREVYALCNEKLKDPSMSVRGIITRSNVRLICTTDDPADSLEWHQQLKADPSFETKVLPAWRPDKAKAIDTPEYPDYLEKLGQAAGMEIRSFADLKEALRRRMDFFASVGCSVSDHALEYVVYAPASEETVEAIFRRRMEGSLPSEEECRQFITAFMLFVGREYARRGWVMQLHFGCKRNNNTRRFREMGPDTGFDCIGTSAPVAQMADFLNALDGTGELPKTILYSLNPNDNAAIGSVLGCFQDSSAAAKLQQGSAWWFNDHFQGMTDQMTSLANLGALANFVGMLTDSRSFLSYTRHDYFRRILCRLLGSWVEEGLYPADWETLGQIVRDIGYNNAVRYFGFPLETV